MSAEQVGRYPKMSDIGKAVKLAVGEANGNERHAAELLYDANKPLFPLVFWQEMVRAYLAGVASGPKPPTEA